MKPFLIVAMLFISASTLADDALIITTRDGKNYERVKVTRVEPDGISIVHSAGATKLPFETLSDELQKQYGFDPQSAAEHRRSASAWKAQQARVRAAQQGREARFKGWEQAIAQMKHDALYKPELLARGIDPKDEKAVKEKAKAKVAALENKYAEVRQYISLQDSRGVSLAVTQRIIDAVLDGTVYIGMPSSAVVLSWGQPSDINSTITTGSRSDQWIYKTGRYSAQYVYIENGVVSGIQD